MNERGTRGEVKAAEYLTDKGYEIIARNYISRYGEIDIIAQNDEYLIFVEVKARGKGAIGLPREFVDIRKQRKIIKTALCFMAENDISRQPRFDVIEIYDYNEQDSINHIENAFTMEVYDASY